MYEKMFHIIRHQRSANENNTVSPHTIRMAKSRTLITAGAGRGRQGHQGRPDTAGGDAKQRVATREQSGVFLPDQAYSYHTLQQPHSSVFTQRSWKLSSKQNLAHRSLQQPHSELPKLGSGRDVPQWVSGSTNCGAPRQWNIIQRWKETNSQTTKRHSGTSDAYYYVKEANPKWLHTVWFQLYDVLENVETMQAVRRPVVSGGAGGGGRGKEMNRWGTKGS